jgi:adenine phosphoribosyltransferase
MDETERLKGAIRSVPDFPKPGILFRDISPVLEDAALFRSSIDLLAGACEGIDCAKIAGLDARGFIFGAALAYRLGVGFVPIRKKGKLPFRTITHAYDLEYGSAELEIHADSIAPGEKVLLVDDLLATGGTARAAVTLLSVLGASLQAALFLIELEGLGGREALGELPVLSLLRFPA